MLNKPLLLLVTCPCETDQLYNLALRVCVAAQNATSHTGAVMKMGKDGAILSMFAKQKLNTRSSCEAELVGADDAATKILWTKMFMEAQRYEIEENIIYQDNKSTILLLENGKRSSSKRTRAINIRYFFLTDQ